MQYSIVGVLRSRNGEHDYVYVNPSLISCVVKNGLSRDVTVTLVNKETGQLAFLKIRAKKDLKSST